ncbi:hypothetical protein H8958_021995 [Nasalis larvatus]
MDGHFVVAGSPSGHAMGSSCVWYVMVTAALSHTICGMDKFSITLHRLLNIDLLWSVPIAKKWCANPDWIHIDTMPFAGLVRNLGVLFGLGFAVNSEMFLLNCRGGNSYTLSFRLLCALTSLTTLQLYHFFQIPTQEEHLFYVLSFCKSASIPLTVVTFIPYCVHMLMKQNGKKIQ